MRRHILVTVDDAEWPTSAVEDAAAYVGVFLGSIGDTVETTEVANEVAERILNGAW